MKIELNDDSTDQWGRQIQRGPSLPTDQADESDQ
jgi:hypothetical protein